MKLATFTHPRSPWPKTIALIAFLGGIIILSYLISYDSSPNKDGDSTVMVLNNPDSPAIIVALGLIILGAMLSIVGVLRTAVYARRNPRYKKGWFMGNIELRDDDEAISRATDKATRGVYTYNLWAYTCMIVLFGLRIIPTDIFLVVSALSIAFVGTILSYAWRMRNIEFED